MPIPYVRQTWVDGAGGATPVSAARLGVIEQGISDISQAPAVQATHSTTQSITQNVMTALAFNTDVFDQALGAASTMHDPVTNNSRLTCRYAGIYMIAAGTVTWASNPGNASLAFRLNGGTTFAVQQVVNDYRGMSTSDIRQLAVNDYVECVVQQFSAGAINLSTGISFSMVRIA